MSNERVKEVVDDLNKDWEDFKERHLSEVQELKTDVRDMKERVYSPAIGGSASKDLADSIEMKAFDQYLRTGDRTGMMEAEKAWSATTGDGANAVPKQIAKEVDRLVLQQSPIRQHAKVVRAESGDYRHLVADDDMGASWAGESTTRSVTDTPTLRTVEPAGGELYAVVQVSRWHIEDATFDVPQFLITEAARQFAAAESTAFISGSGTNQPTGFTTGATSASTDQASPKRSFGTYQHIPSGVAADLPNDQLGSPLGDPLAPFADTVAAMRVGYLSNSAWYMNPSVKAEIIKKRDANGRPLVESGLMGNPDRLLGYPIRVAEHLPAIAADALPIWFGAMDPGYLIVDRGNLIVIRDEVTTRGHVLFYLAKRVYGAPCDTNSLKALKIATS